MTTKAGDGERNAMGGYHPQYLWSASQILETLANRNLEWIRVADPDAGQVDDSQIATPNRLDAHQIKWVQHASALTWHNLTQAAQDENSLIKQLAGGWETLKRLHPNRRIVVHLVTNRIPAYTESGMPDVSSSDKPKPYHLSAFIEQAWKPAQKTGVIDWKSEWKAAWEALQTASGLPREAFQQFVPNCELDFSQKLPEPVSEDTVAIYNLLITTVASPERIVELNSAQLLEELGWSHRYHFRNKHEFPAPYFVYKPIRVTLRQFRQSLESLQGGYIGIFGSPGSGKSTFLTRTIRELPHRAVRYYAYIPDVDDQSALRGESINFFHDVTLSLDKAGFRSKNRVDPSNRLALMQKFQTQLHKLGEDYKDYGRKTIILIDGLDHIEREQNPSRSLLNDLPLPSSIPDGVYIVIGSQPIAIPQLPVSVRQALSQEGRRIDITDLVVSDVYEIAEDALPQLGYKEKRRVFELTNGHPLVLTYILNALKHLTTWDEQVRFLEETRPYKGDIEAEYFAHWMAIEGEDDLIHLLGLLTRIRGSIPMRWVQTWAIRTALKRIQGLFGQYFLEDSQGQWTFFHNSFRLFLEEKTADPLPGQRSEEVSAAYHFELAEHYLTSTAPWLWESLYHFYQAGEFQRVVDIAQYDWFREQTEALRPIDAIETDTRLAVRAAGEIGDAKALIRLTLVGVALEQRVQALNDSELPNLLCDVGEHHLAAEYGKDGARLRLDREKALNLSKQLFHVGLIQDAQRLFELAEPLEELSGHPISAKHADRQDIYDLLCSWVEAALVFNSPEEIIPTIQRIQIEPSWRNQDEGVEKSSRRLHVWLYYKAALACYERGALDSWQQFLAVLDSEQARTTRFFVYLRSAEMAYYEHNNPLAAIALLESLLAMQRPDSLAEGRNGIANCLEIAELAYHLSIPEATSVIQEYLDLMGQIPLEDNVSTTRDKILLSSLQFRYGRLRFLLTPSLTARQLLREAEALTDFRNLEQETILIRKQIHFIMLNLAKLWADGELGFKLNPSVFVSNIRWIINLIEGELRIGGSRSEISQWLIVCASKQVDGTLAALQEEFSSRWENNPDNWFTGDQRKIVLAFYDNGIKMDWVHKWLHDIESRMLIGSGVHSRIEASEEQTQAWLKVGNREAAAASLKQIVKNARGIWHDEDYQMVRWGKWLRQVNQLEPDKFQERTATFLQRAAHDAEIAATKDDALLAILRSLFDFAPQPAIIFYKRLLEDKRLPFWKCASSLLEAALEHNALPLVEVYFVIAELLIPLSRNASPSTVEKYIIRAENILGKEATIQHTRRLVSKIRTVAIANQRIRWFKGIRDGLSSIGIGPENVGIQVADMEYPNDDRGSSYSEPELELQSEEKLTLLQVIDTTNTLADLQGYLAHQKQGNSSSFDWRKVAKHLIAKLTEPAELFEVIKSVEGRLSNYSVERYLAELNMAVGERLYKLGFQKECDEVLEKAFALTDASGWSINYDGGTKYQIMRRIIASQNKSARERFVKEYALDLGQRFWNPEQILMYGDELTNILFEDIPYIDIWQDIEDYLDELFEGIEEDTEPELCRIISEAVQAEEAAAPAKALADFLILHLDFPAYSVSDTAVRAVSRAIIEGSVTTKNGLLAALQGNEQLVKQALKVLDVISLIVPNNISEFTQRLDELRQSDNFIVRYRANEIYCRLTDQSTTPPKVERGLAMSSYALHLPSIAHHNTMDLARNQPNPILLNDSARQLSPVDIEARNIAKIASVPEDNVLYQAAQKLSWQLKQRTWFSDQLTFSSEKLSIFLQNVDLQYSHTKLHIAPARNAVAHVAAELYDLGYVASEDWAFLASVFRTYDPYLFMHEPRPRPSFIERIGGLEYSRDRYVSLPKDWVKKAQESLPLLSVRSTDERIILGEWTKLRRLEENWPYEERLSFTRLAALDEFWEGYDPTGWELPLARVEGGHFSDYVEMTEFAPTELVIAHTGHFSQPSEYPWLGLNPDFGHAMGWHPSDRGWLRWVDDENRTVVESVLWQDGPIQNHNQYEHVEVGRGWYVVITEDGYRALADRFRQLNRGGVVRRRLGWLGSEGMGNAHSLLNTI